MVDAATSLLDNYGIADLTMRRLARELNVSPGALYWHFANKQQLLGAVADRILGSVDDVPGSWRDRTTGICGGLRDALLSHTDGAELVSASFAAGQSEVMAQILSMADRSGCRGRRRSEHAELTARTVVYYVLGFTADEQSRLQWESAGPNCPTRSRCLPTMPREVSLRRRSARRRYRRNPVVGLPTSLFDVITVDDVRRITSSLPRSYEVVVRDHIKFRAGRHVFVAFSRDETVMGVRLSQGGAGRDGGIRTREVLAAAQIRYAIQLGSRPTRRDRLR